MSEGTQDRGALLLLLGALVGLALGATGLGDSRAGGEVPRGAVATVGEQVISEADYRRAVAAFAADTGPVGPEEKRRVLDRLIDEALLVEGGVALGLPSRDRTLRNAVSAAMISLIVTSAEEALGAPTEAELRAFYEDNAYLFGHPGRVHVRQVFFAADRDDAAARASERLRAGAAWSEVRALGDPDPGALPDGMVPPHTLREYFGPSVAQALLDLPEGATSAPLSTALGLHVVRVVAREAGARRPFGEVRELVARELVRRAGDEALRGYLDERRAEARIVVAGERL